MHGDLIVNTLTSAGVKLRLDRIEEPTTVVRVSTGRGTPEFEVVRDADQLFDSQVDLEGVDVVHTSAFALSFDPLRSRILNTLAEARKAGISTSIDLNFSPKVWGVEAEAAHPVLAEAVRQCDLVKCSVDDLERIFGPDWHGELLFKWGDPLVILTAGRDHTSIFDDGRLAGRHVGVPPAPVVDTTGAGDVFWAAFLAGSPRRAARVQRQWLLATTPPPSSSGPPGTAHRPG